MKRVLLIFTCIVASLSFAADVRQTIANGNIDNAIQELNARTQASPADDEAYHLLSRAYFVLEDWDRAITAGEKAVSLKPQNSEYHLWFGRAYGSKAEHAGWFSAMGLAKKSRKELEKAVELDGNNSAARTDLAEFYMEAPGIVGGGKDKALAQADALNASDAASGHWVKGRLAEKNGQLDVAEQEYKTAISVSKTPARDWLNLASFYGHHNRMPEKQATIQKAVEVDRAGGSKKSKILFEAAISLFHSGDLNGAVELARRYVAAPQKTEDAPAFQAHYLLAQILEKQGKPAAALDEYRATLALAQQYQPAQEAARRLQH
jgi:tetratricopeptide (TPR) repeat protein